MTNDPRDYFARHPIRLASVWPSLETALFGGDLQSPAPTTHTPERCDHAQEEKDSVPRE
jgi:hypothetical protein